MRTALVLMNAIKYSAMKKILLLLLFSIYMAHPAFPAMKELEDLDKLIENKNQYDQLKRQRISSAKKKLAQASDAETRFNLLMEIGNEYTLFKADSAVLYFDRAINEARRGNNKKNILRAQLKKIRPEIIAGYYAEARSEFRMLQNQVNPHFLFNSLNILMDIIENDKDRAGEFTEALSDIYRYVLSTHHRTRVTVSEEMSFLESYIHILTLKYNNFLEVDINDSLQGTRYIIPFTMQILLENVTKHNTISDRCPMKVTITVDNSGITVRNPVNLRKSTGTGLGLRYLITQYEAAGRQFSASGDGKFFTAIIPYL